MGKQNRMMGLKVEIEVTPVGWKFASADQMARVIRSLYLEPGVRIVDVHLSPARVSVFAMVARDEVSAAKLDALTEALKTSAHAAFFSVSPEAPSEAATV